MSPVDLLQVRDQIVHKWTCVLHLHRPVFAYTSTAACTTPSLDYACMQAHPPALHLKATRLEGAPSPSLPVALMDGLQAQSRYDSVAVAAVAGGHGGGGSAASAVSPHHSWLCCGGKIRALTHMCAPLKQPVATCRHVPGVDLGMQNAGVFMHAQASSSSGGWFWG